MKSTMGHVAAATLALTATMGLAACGGDDKPSKADVQSGMTKMLSKEAAGSGSEGADAVAKMSRCIIDETYSKLSTKALEAIAKGNEEAKALTDDDDKALSTASDTCTKKLGK